ncbi:hypothetical protein Droror1_Dr00013797 [Drosera rotundifolia]
MVMPQASRALVRLFVVAMCFVLRFSNLKLQFSPTHGVGRLDASLPTPFEVLPVRPPIQPCPKLMLFFRVDAFEF